MSSPPGGDDRSVETALRDILEPLDRRLARVSAVFPLVLVTVLPAFFFAVWIGLDMSGRRAFALSAGPCCLLLAFYLGWELLSSRLALGRFNRRFPPGSAERGTALRILAEMRTPTRAEEKLRLALAATSPDRIIREPARPMGEPLAGPHAPVGEARRPGGYYDYIPLEPRSEASEQRRPTPG
ncbi:MAG: hypothetical protein U0736_15115 [Gemmataceae bacterium]